MALLSSLHPQVVLLDIDHLDNGLELARQIKLESADVPVLILSSSGDPDLVVKGMRTGAYDFLVKPVATATLQECLQGRAGPERRARHSGASGRRWREHRPAGPEPRPPVPEQRAHAGGGGHRPAGRRHQRHHPPPGRERHRQGDGGPGHPPYIGPPGQAVPEGQLRVPARATFSSPSCSATRRAPSPGPTAASPASSSWPTGGPSCWTRSARCPSGCRPSCSTCSRTASSSGWAAATSSPPTPG